MGRVNGGKSCSAQTARAGAAAEVAAMAGGAVYEIGTSRRDVSCCERKSCVRYESKSVMCDGLSLQSNMKGERGQSARRERGKRSGKGAYCWSTALYNSRALAYERRDRSSQWSCSCRATVDASAVDSTTFTSSGITGFGAAGGGGGSTSFRGRLAGAPDVRALDFEARLNIGRTRHI